MYSEIKKRYAFKLGIRLAISAAVAAVAVAATIWRGESSGLAASIGIAAFAVTALIARVPSLLAPGWDGVVTNKTVRYRTTAKKINAPEYELTVTDPHGREHHDIFLDESDDDLPNRIEYYDNGERVRRHRGFKYFEKFDKSGKNSVVCIDCGTLNPKTRERCANCNLSLLRDNIVQ
jgi:ribosomal protein L40E